jgi:hypothetical protein
VDGRRNPAPVDGLIIQANTHSFGAEFRNHPHYVPEEVEPPFIWDFPATLTEAILYLLVIIYIYPEVSPSYSHLWLVVNNEKFINYTYIYRYYIHSHLPSPISKGPSVVAAA